MKNNEQLIKIAEELGWNVDIDENEITFSQYTSRGQDFSFYVDKNKKIAEEVGNYHERYDPSEEAILWCDSSGHGKNGAPYHLKDIVADMEEAKEMVSSLYVAMVQ